MIVVTGKVEFSQRCVYGCEIIQGNGLIIDRGGVDKVGSL